MMLKTLFATSATVALLAFGAQAQEQPGSSDAATPQPPRVEPEMAPESPMVEGSEAEATGETSPNPTVAEDPAQPAPANTMAADPAEPAPADTMAADPAEVPADTMAQEPAAPAGETLTLEEGWSEVDVATISTDTLIGADVRTYDQERIAAIDDVILTPDGQVENLVARFGGFLGFGESTVLLTMDEVRVVSDADGNMVVLTDLTPEALKDRPAYEAEEEPVPDAG
jgi:hypothetical protein